MTIWEKIKAFFKPIEVEEKPVKEEIEPEEEIQEEGDDSDKEETKQS